MEKPGIKAAPQMITEATETVEAIGGSINWREP